MTTGNSQVWLRSTDDVDLDWLRESMLLFDPEEHARAARFQRRQDWLDYCFAHALRRNVVATRLCVEESRVKFSRQTSGFPVLAEPTEVRISTSLSHSNGWVAVATSDGRPVGVDVECLGTRLSVDHLGIIPMLSPREREHLSGLSATDCQVGFLCTWVGKEAYAKARGRGLSLALESYSVVVNHMTCDVEFTPSRGDAKQWMIQVSRPNPNLFLALAVTQDEAASPQL